MYMIKHLLLISSTKELIKESFWLYALVITFYLLFFVAIGSFLNVLIYRLPKKMSIIKKSSHCPLCGYKIKWYENIPIFSYLFLRGRCHHCQEKINIRYVIVEVLGLLVAIVSLIRFDLSYTSIIVTLLLEIFIAIFFIDKDELIIPDSLNIAVAVLGLLSIIMADITSLNHEYTIDDSDKFLSLLVNIIIIGIFYIIQKIIRKPVIGGGDLKLFLGIGLFMGWQLEILGLGIACIIGAGVELIFSKKLNRKIVPFGPYLVIGFTISLFFGPDLILWYLHLFQ
jgi:Type II secretory pathway, prepilin signal peptidase PulO and related peptidases